MKAFVPKENESQKRLFWLSNFPGAASCRGCPIVLEQSLFVSEQQGNHDTSQLFKMAAPGKL